MQKLDHEVQLQIEKIHDKAIHDQMMQSYKVEMQKIQTMISENAKNRAHDTDERRKDRAQRYVQMAVDTTLRTIGEIRAWLNPFSR